MSSSQGDKEAFLIALTRPILYVQPMAVDKGMYTTVFVIFLHLMMISLMKTYGVTKASELVPCSLLPHWNSMQFFATVSLSD